MNKYLEKLKNSIFSPKEETESKKKNIENMVVFLIILIITIIIINTIIKDDEDIINKEDENIKLAETTRINDNANNELDISKDLENILSNITGAGEVKVLLTYSETSQIVPLYNENINESITEETDTSGGKRTINSKDNQKEVIYEEGTGGKKVVTQKIVSPKIEGAIITAKGARDANIKNNIIQAVEAATGLAIHKIQVFEMK